MTKSFAVVLLTIFAAACGGNSTTTPSAMMTAVSGTWVGTGSDSSSSMGTGSMMGQTGMGTMTWQLTQNGSAVTGSLSFSGMMGMVPGSFSGTMSGEDMTFTMTMPAGSMGNMGAMMGSSCSAQVTGTSHINGSTITCTYSGTNSCTGPFSNGQMTMTHR
jgi:hypothetical protein